MGQQEDKTALDEQDPDLVTTLDKQRQLMIEKKRRRQAQENAINMMKEQRAARQKWTSVKSDAIGYSKLMVDYFNFINEASEGDDKAKGTFERAMARLEVFCEEN